ncbi:DUF4402 domain-containing protein [Parasphingorhabdus litoris]|nr:DUF4402 domain-containing protein [Parasphingorhabdus litoris]
MEQIGDQKRALKPGFARAAMLLPALCSLVAASAANAQSADTMASVSRSITVVKNSDLLFGDFIAGTANSNFRMHAVTGNLIQLSGDAVSIGGAQSRASFTATGTPFAQANIRRSQNSINIVRDGGSETMRVDNFWLGNSGGLRDQILDAAGQATYFVGGRLRIGPNQAAGTYRGTFEVTIDYQ